MESSLMGGLRLRQGLFHRGPQRTTNIDFFLLKTFA